MDAEKIICTDGGMNAGEMAALMNNNNFSNSPWMYLVFLALFGGNGFGWNRNGNSEIENANSRAIASLSNQMADNHNSDLVLQAINGSRDAMGQLAQTFNTDFGNIQTAICGVRSAIEQVGGQIGYSAESVKNAIALGDSNIIQQMQSCCCQNKELVQRMGYEGQLRDQANTSAIQQRIDQLANGIQTGFAQVGYQSQQNTQAIIQNATANTQRILDQMCANTTQELRDSIAEKDRQLQTANIIAGLKASGCSCGC